MVLWGVSSGVWARGYAENWGAGGRTQTRREVRSERMKEICIVIV